MPYSLFTKVRLICACMSVLPTEPSLYTGYYTDSILKFRLIFPSNYPEQPPTVQFLTDVFHPLISQQDGTFNLAPRFRPWRSVRA